MHVVVLEITGELEVNLSQQLGVEMWTDVD